jgi:hypothetical protein
MNQELRPTTELLLEDILCELKIANARAERMETKMRGIINETESLQNQTKIIKNNIPRLYDWWRLENGTYAKVYRIQLEGVLYQEDGKELQQASWNPLNMASLDRLDGKWNLKNRKSGDNPAGWPDWCK